jgi:hypothetical protein
MIVYTYTDTTVHGTDVYVQIPCMYHVQTCLYMSGIDVSVHVTSGILTYTLSCIYRYILSYTEFNGVCTMLVYNSG